MEASAEKSVTKANVLVLLSGGIDSTACVAYYQSLGYDVSSLFIDYGQPEARLERAAAIAIAEYYVIPLKQLGVLGYKAPEGYVPARNAMLLSAGLMSFDYGYGIIALGIHAGTPYADCSPDFEQAMQRVFDLYSQGRVRIDAPFLHWTKDQIWDYAQMTGVPLVLIQSNNLNSLHPKADWLRAG
jgi:7-cyano-7-deazaguanine synthase